MKELVECADCGIMDDSIEEDARGLEVCPWCYVHDEDEEDICTLDGI